MGVFVQLGVVVRVLVWLVVRVFCHAEVHVAEAEAVWGTRGLLLLLLMLLLLLLLLLLMRVLMRVLMLMRVLAVVVWWRLELELQGL
jgi:hypothetical protein